MAPEIEKISIPLLLEFSANLPASPRIFARLSKLIESDDTAIDFISGIVKMDPGLAAQILRVTNSAYYGAAMKVVDIESAIARIGFNEVHKVLSMVISHDCFYQALPCYGQTATEFADECIGVAVASEIISKRIGIDPNTPYIAGLLHSIGKLAINLYMEKHDQAMDFNAAAGATKLSAWELETLGLTHWRAGYELLRHWQFDSEIWQSIKNQHAPVASPSYVRSTAVLTLAIWIAEQTRGFDPDAGTPPEITWAFAKLGIDALDAASLIDETRFEFNDRQNLFSMLL